MATEAGVWMALFLALTVPLIVFAWMSLINRLNKIEEETERRMDAFEANIMNDIRDKHTDARHRIENIQTQLAEMLMVENRETSSKLIRSIELMVELLRRPMQDEVLARREINRNSA